MKRAFILLLLIPFFALAQEKGIHFEHNSTWAQIKAKAKAENKHIFVDCFTTWCGPCIWMANNVFPQEKVGTFFNANFVNLKIQMDETEGDNQDVKSWREEAKRFAEDYEVKAYPTFLIFNPDGELVHRIIGGGEADQFIALAKKGLNPETQYMTLVKKFEANPNDKVLAKSLASVALEVYDEATAQKAQAIYIDLATEDELFSPENIEFLKSTATNTESKAFALVRENKDKLDAIQGKGTANTILAPAIMSKIVYPELRNTEGVDWSAISDKAKSSYPDIDITQEILALKPQFYLYTQNWSEFRVAVNEYINAVGDNVDANTLNEFAWAVFENCNDADCVKSALDWSKKSLNGEEKAAYLDTYANLLYKSGDQADAIKWSERALAAANDGEKAQYQEALNKIKNGEPTWETADAMPE